MNATENFTIAARADNIGAWIFYGTTLVSGMLVAFPGPILEEWLHPALILAAVSAVACTAVTTIYQARGNRLLRLTQLTDALGVPVGEQPRAGYFNSPNAHALRRLAMTTLENTFFSTEVLGCMLAKERLKNAGYFGVLLLFLSVRFTSTNWLLLLAQALFSADLLLAWIRMERYRLRTDRVHETLRQFFLQQGSTESAIGEAIVLAAFADYECAKDEASLPLDSEVFSQLNPELSKRWEALKSSLGLGS